MCGIKTSSRLGKYRENHVEERLFNVLYSYFNTYELANNQIFFGTPRQVHQVIETKASSVFVMTFSDPFFVEYSIPLSFIENLKIFQNYGQSPPFITNNQQYEDIAQSTNQIFLLF